MILGDYVAVSLKTTLITRTLELKACISLNPRVENITGFEEIKSAVLQGASPRIMSDEAGEIDQIEIIFR